MQVHWTLCLNLSYFMLDSVSTVPVSQHIYVHSSFKVVSKALLRFYPEVVLSYPGVGREAACPMFTCLCPLFISVLCGVLCTVVLYMCSMWVWLRECIALFIAILPRCWALPTQVPGSTTLTQRCLHRSLSVISDLVTLLFDAACVVVYLASHDWRMTLW